MSKKRYLCNECGASSPQWQGQCRDCSSWNSFHLEGPSSQYAGAISKPTSLMDIEAGEKMKTKIGIAELDRALGGGLVSASVVLLGGEPGIGKSTILLQMLSQFKGSSLYVSGEESLQQIKLRAERLGITDAKNITLLAETNIENIIATAKNFKPKVLIIDSVQTAYTPEVSSAAGSVSQLRESTSRLVQFAKTHEVTVFLVGHVTKEGAIAGPKVLEHMVDTVLYFEAQQRLRILRAVKNRFGAAGEMGLFSMFEEGLREVRNPSAIFLSHKRSPRPGSIITPCWEGTRPLLAEVQSLVDNSYLTNPRRVCVGVETNRLSLILAVLSKYVGISSYDKDIFINVVGGLELNETAGDLAVAFAVVSSLGNHSLPNDLIAFGEIGLSGEIRPVTHGQERLQEAMKLGFKQAIVPMANMPKQEIVGLNIIGVSNLQEGLKQAKNL